MYSQRNSRFKDIALKGLANENKSSLPLYKKTTVPQCNGEIIFDEASERGLSLYNKNTVARCNDEVVYSEARERNMSFSRMESYRNINSVNNALHSIAAPFSARYDKMKRERRASTVKTILSEQMKKIQFERLTLKQIFTRYVQASTLHGFRYSCSDTYFIRRFIWSCLMVMGVIYFGIKLKNGIGEYLQYPFSTLSTIEHVESLSFPAISLCMINSFNLSKIKNSRYRKLYNEKRLPLYTNRRQPHFDVPGDKLKEFLNTSSFSIHETFEECDWIKQDTNNPNKPPHSCGTHNFTSYFNNKGQVCFTINGFRDEYKKLKVTKKGLRHGFELLLNLHTREAMTVQPLAGVQVIVHNQNEPPSQLTGFFASAGYKTFVSLTKVESTNLPPPYATQCGDVKLKYYSKYNRKACLLEKLTDLVGEKCSCREPFMSENGLKDCSLKETIQCSYPTQELYNQYSLRKYCPVDCSVVHYSTKLSAVQYIHNPPKGIEERTIKRLYEYKNMTKESILLKMSRKLSKEKLDEFIEENLVQLIFYYEEMAVEKADQEATLDFYQFLGDMGGEIGLVLGASLLTCFEFVDLLFFLAYNQLLRFKKEKLEKKQIIDDESADEAFLAT